MVQSLHTSLEYAALNLDLRRPRSAARHLRYAIRVMFRLEESTGNFPAESFYWFIRSLHALSRAHYLRCSGALKEGLDRIPETPPNAALLSHLRKLEKSLQQCDLTAAAKELRATNKHLKEMRRPGDASLAVGA